MSSFVNRRTGKFVSKYSNTKRKRKPSLAKKVKKVQSTVNSLVKGEMRHLLIPVGFSAVTQAGVYTLMNGMPVGDGEGTREGNTTTVWNSQHRIHVRPDATLKVTTASDFVYRLMLFIDHQPNGVSPPATSELLDNNGSNTNNYHAPFNWLNRRRFTILYDKNYVFQLYPNTRQAIANTTFDIQSRAIKILRRFPKGLKTQYNNGNAGLVTDIVKNTFYMAEFCSDNTEIESSSMCVILYSP